MQKRRDFMSQERLAGKTVLITAAAQGIGHASALACAREGALVWATDIADEQLAGLEGMTNIQSAHLDVTDAAAIEAFAKDRPAPDVLLNCAGFVHHGSVLDSLLTDWRDAFELNVMGMVHTIRTFLPGMLERGSGSIINMASVVSSLKGAPGRCVYAATKAAVVGLTKSVAADYVAQGIRCNAICPGTVDTPSLHERIAAQGDAEKARAAFVARQPMGRLGEASEIAALVVYLASDESSYTTGATHVIDGGWTI